MRVCQVLAGNEDGGLEKHTIELAKGLAEQGIEVTVIAHKDFEPLFKNVKFIALDLSKGRNNPFILYKFYKILKEKRFDVIHAQANKATAMVAKIKPFLDTKVVATLHNMKKNLKAFYKMDHVITVSNTIGKQLNMENKTTIYNGLELEEVTSIDLYKKYDIPQDRFIICSVGRFAMQKRFDVLINSMQYLQNIHLVLVGYGEEEESLKKLAGENDLQDKITFTGMVENIEAKQIVKSSKLFVLPSDKEGFGYVFAEALFMQTPIISTDVADIKDTLGENYMIPFDDPKSLAKKVEIIKENYDDTLRDFENGIFNFAKDNFTIQNMIDKTIDIYKSVFQ